MAGFPNDAGDDRGWRHSPKVAVAAVAVSLLSLVVIGFSCLGPCHRRSERPPGLPKAEDAIVLICPHCETQHTVTASDVRDIPGRGLAVKAAKVPCPKCGRTDSIEALRCEQCGKYFLPTLLDSPPGGRPAPGAPGPRRPPGSPRCPHCGKNPFSK